MRWNDSADPLQLVGVGRGWTTFEIGRKPVGYRVLDGLDGWTALFLIRKGESVTTCRVVGTSHEPSMRCQAVMHVLQNRREKSRPGRPSFQILQAIKGLTAGTVRPRSSRLKPRAVQSLRTYFNCFDPHLCIGRMQARSDDPGHSLSDDMRGEGSERRCTGALAVSKFLIRTNFPTTFEFMKTVWPRLFRFLWTAIVSGRSEQEA
jgi:hypothetical protein